MILPAPKSVRIAVLVVLVALCTILAFQRNSIWVTKLSLWTDVAKKTPGKSRVHNSLGNCYSLAGKPFQAIEEYKRAIALDNNNIEAYYNLAANLEKVGILNQAIYYYDFFCRANPPDYAEAARNACERVTSLYRETGLRRR